MGKRRMRLMQNQKYEKMRQTQDKSLRDKRRKKNVNKREILKTGGGDVSTKVRKDDTVYPQAAEQAKHLASKSTF